MGLGGRQGQLSPFTGRLTEATKSEKALLGPQPRDQGPASMLPLDLGRLVQPPSSLRSPFCPHLGPSSLMSPLECSLNACFIFRCSRTVGETEKNHISIQKCCPHFENAHLFSVPQRPLGLLVCLPAAPACSCTPALQAARPCPLFSSSPTLVLLTATSTLDRLQCLGSISFLPPPGLCTCSSSCLEGPSLLLPCQSCYSSCRAQWRPEPPRLP